MYSLEAIEIIVSGTNRFNEAQKGVFVCAFRGCNYELDGIRVERSGRKYSDKKKLSNDLGYNLSHIDSDFETCQDQSISF